MSARNLGAERLRAEAHHATTVSSALVMAELLVESIERGESKGDIERRAALMRERMAVERAAREAAHEARRREIQGFAS